IVVDESGAPVEGVNLSARAMEEGRQGWGWARSKGDGTFEMENVRQGAYRIQAHKKGYEPGAVEGVQAGSRNVRITLTRAPAKQD
ncbi:MAG: carboxypeptidase-like regulatory domain-containing protein, partial [Planctomycetota bacterium]